MNKNVLKYIFIIFFLFGIWNLLLGYFPFLIFFIFVVLMICLEILSFIIIRKTSFSWKSHRYIIERGEKLRLLFARHGPPIQSGKIVIEYTVSCQKQCLFQRRVIIEDQEIEDILLLPHCGYYTIEIVQVKYFDILQCFYQLKKAHQILDCYVFPINKTVHFDFIETSGVYPEADEYSPYYKGEDYAEVFDVRPYREDDSLRHIHWKLSMKKNELYVKEGSMPILKKVLLVVDFHDIDDEDDQALDILYSLCLLLSKRQIQFELLCPQIQSIQYQPELICNQEHLKECLKRILKTPAADIVSMIPEYAQAYLITSQGIEVYAK